MNRVTPFPGMAAINELHEYRPLQREEESGNSELIYFMKLMNRSHDYFSPLLNA